MIIHIIEQLRLNLLMLSIIHILILKKKLNDKDPKFKVGDHVKIYKYKNIFAKGYAPNWSEIVSVIKKLKIQFHGHISLMISMAKKLLKHL